jgi:hydrogenase maturation protease
MAQAMLAAPIILYDYPRVAAASPTNLFDSTEIDEILHLRILTLTERETAEARRADEHVAQLLDQVHGLGAAEAAALHGTWRSSPGDRLRRGSRVRLRPARRADLIDRALEGKEATVVAIEEDLEGRLHVGVVIDDDPGRDLGLAGWPGHRFFFAVEEMELLP